MVAPTRVCKRCGKDFPASEMKYFGNAQTLLCKDCFNQKQQLSVQEEKRTSLEKEKRTKYRCYKCGYTFMQGKSYNRGCPYCGSQKIVAQEVTPNIDKLIAESGSDEYER